MRENKTFRGGDPFWANACVGNNGTPDYYDYAKGFSEGANLLIKGALSNNGCTYPVDTFIYPICFNMRHSVELRLKGAVVTLNKIANLREPLPLFNLESSHDIGKIWAYIKAESTKIDERLEFFLQFLDNYILDLAEIDPTGQTFRYPFDNEKTKHLTEIPTINVGILYRRFGLLERYLDSLENYLHQLELEYGLGTYTKKLSRQQLLQIANEIPAYHDWGLVEFKSFKDAIKKQYGFGSKDFSEAVKKIKTLYLSNPTKLEPQPLKHLTLDTLTKFIKYWIEINSAPQPTKEKKIETINLGNTRAMQNAFQEGMERQKKIDEIIPDLETSLSTDQLADLNALYESGDGDYPEHYPFHVDYYCSEFKSGSYSFPGGKKEALNRLLKKSDAPNRILRCLYLIGQRDLAEDMILEHNFESVFDWIEAARTHTLFIDPCNRMISGLMKLYQEDILSVTN